jgi:hypothetical protein
MSSRLLSSNGGVAEAVRQLSSLWSTGEIESSGVVLYRRGDTAPIISDSVAPMPGLTEPYMY